jgi:mono/diheme cytochrome c family protein
MKDLRIWLATISAFFGLWCSAAAFSKDNMGTGHELVVAHCARCHIVDESNRFTGISSTPSFKTLITALPDWRRRFETFYARNPHPSIIRIEGIPPPTETPSPNKLVDLSQSDIEAIIFYVRSYAKTLGAEK